MVYLPILERQTHRLGLDVRVFCAVKFNLDWMGDAVRTPTISSTACQRRILSKKKGHDSQSHACSKLKWRIRCTWMWWMRIEETTHNANDKWLITHNGTTTTGSETRKRLSLIIAYCFHMVAFGSCSQSHYISMNCNNFLSFSLSLLRWGMCVCVCVGTFCFFSDFSTFFDDTATIDVTLDDHDHFDGNLLSADQRNGNSTINSISSR